MFRPTRSAHYLAHAISAVTATAVLACMAAFLAPANAHAHHAPAPAPVPSPNLVGPPAARSAQVLAWDTFADIVCKPQTNQVITKAWGFAPRGMKLWVKYTVLVNGEFWFDKGRTVYASSTGSGAWSIPTEYHFSFIDGGYDMFVEVTNYNTGAAIGVDGDACRL